MTGSALPITPAGAYEPADDLAVVACFFNSENFQSKRMALETFCSSLETSPLAFYRAEVAYGSADFVLPAGDHVLQIRADDVMWQKERLLNLLVARLPERYTKVAWLDADILFERPSWASETSRLLDEYAVVQPYSHAFRLRPGQVDYTGKGDPWLSYAAVRSALPAFARHGPYWAHGHPGYGWAARRDVLRVVGLYDAAVMGTADDLMAHAFGGDFVSECLRHTFLGNAAYLEHYRQWAESAFDLVRGRIGVVDGAALHLWHGELANRGYGTRKVDLVSLGYDPVRHLRVNADGMWSWSSAAALIRETCATYFASRREDQVG